MDVLLAEKYKNTIGVSFTDRLTDLYNNGFFQISLDPAVVNYLIEFVAEERRADTAQNQD